MAAIGIDISQPAQAPTETYALLVAYQVFAAAIAALTWNDWWLDAKLAGPAHAVDIILFTIIVYLTEGYTSPFFIFFVFILLSASIRWGWRETTLTAILLAILYIAEGLFSAHASIGFQLYRFVVRAGQLVILSLILIWFGIHQWRARMAATILAAAKKGASWAREISCTSRRGELSSSASRFVRPADSPPGSRAEIKRL